MKDKKNKVTGNRLLNKIVVYVYKYTVFKNYVYAILVASIFLIWFLLNMGLKEDRTLGEELPNYPTDLKYILFWKQSSENEKYFNNSEDQLPEGQSMFIDQKCEYINCFITYNKNLLRGNMANFDVVVFNINDIYTVKKINALLDRSPKQLYVFNSMDSALLFPICFPDYDNFFNLTWTYKLDSDIPQPFFRIYNTKNELIGPKKQMNWIMDMTDADTQRYKNVISSKNKAVAWITNRCRSKLKHNKLITEFRDELRAYNKSYNLDIYGRCGANKCPGNNISYCYELIEKDYYFQMVLEDTSSADHVTEKMAVAMMQTVIPIVQGGPEYDSYLPPGSHINAENETISDLGGLVDYAIKNPDYYQYFLQWKNYYRYEVTPKNYLCDLCAYINKNAGKVKLSYPKFRDWWNPDHRGECTRKRLYDIFFDYAYV